MNGGTEGYGRISILSCPPTLDGHSSPLCDRVLLLIKAMLQLFVSRTVSRCRDVAIITQQMQQHARQWKKKPDGGFWATNRRQWKRSDGKCLTDKWHKIKTPLQFILITQDVNNNPFPCPFPAKTLPPVKRRKSIPNLP